MRVLALIPARGGSVTLPRKNILPFCGKPLIAYSINAARSAAEAGAPIDRVIISTEDAEIAKIGREWGAEVPFMRPPDLARSDTPSLPVVQHALTFIEEQEGGCYDWVLLLQPTSPLRTGDDILRALQIAQEPETTAAVGVTSANNAHPAKLKLVVDGVLKPYLGDTLVSQRRQDFGFDVYKTNGAIYLTRRDVLMEQDSFFGVCPRPLVMPPERSLDIDTRLDFEISEVLYRKLQMQEFTKSRQCAAQAT
jgi:CMP-N,N'-diacetyllegionaminic acid synthase